MGEWVRAKACSSHTCIEVGMLEHGAPGGTVVIRDAATADDYEPNEIWVTPAEWATFVQGVKDGDFDDL